ncbi:MAG TPA: SRPBCC family protein [Burkholderiales bacterium]
MQFSHLIQINDPLDPLIDPLSREQLWRGLVLRAENPLLFVMALDGFEIVERGDNMLARELRFGKLTLRDRVRFEPMKQVRYEIEAAGDSPAATLVMTIEEPEPGQLFVRFDYETQQGEAAAPIDEFYSSFAKQAYVEADIDTVSTIRRLALEQGGLGAP